MTQPHALYRFYSATGQLLYVGITNNPGSRFTQHQQDKPWWTDVAGISIETYPDRESVLAAERRAIAVEAPQHNVQRPSLRPKGQPVPTPGPRVTGPIELEWLCEACRQPVADGTGYIHISMIHVGTVEAAHLEHQRAHEASGRWQVDMAALLDLPDEAPWQVHHGACDPDPDAGDYWFSIERARTHADLLRWTSHLMDKTWLPYTTWAEFISRAAGRGGDL